MFFHLALTRLAPGSTIIAGNFGRLIAAHGWQHTHALRECALEAARLRIAPDAPSRLACAFGFLTEDAARSWQATEPGFGHHALHVVKPVDPNAKMFAANHRLLPPQGAFHEWPDIYWQTGKFVGSDEHGVPNAEILIGSDIAVIDRLD